MATATLPLELLLRHDRPVPRYTSYPTAQSFHPGVQGSHLLAELAKPNPAHLSLYVHLPFCREACWFCGCNRITTSAGSKAVLPSNGNWICWWAPCPAPDRSPSCTGVVAPPTT